MMFILMRNSVILYPHDLLPHVCILQGRLFYFKFLYFVQVFTERLLGFFRPILRAMLYYYCNQLLAINKLQMNEQV